MSAWMSSTNVQLGAMITTSSFLTGFSALNLPTKKTFTNSNQVNNTTPIILNQEPELSSMLVVVSIISNFFSTTLNFFTLISCTCLILAVNSGDTQIQSGSESPLWVNCWWVISELLLVLGVLWFIFDYFVRFWVHLSLNWLHQIEQTKRVWLYRGEIVACSVVVIAWLGFVVCMFLFPN